MGNILRTKVPVGATRDAFNAFLVDLFGDDPGDEVSVGNAYVSGEDETVATYSFGNFSASTADTAAIQNYLSVNSAGFVIVHPQSPYPGPAWDEALAVWNLKPVSPGI